MLCNLTWQRKKINGLKHWTRNIKRRILKLSGGQQQRVAIARTLSYGPEIILADEPTASLDMENRERIVTLLFRMNKEFNTTIITVTHDLEIANRHDRVIHLERRKWNGIFWYDCVIAAGDISYCFWNFPQEAEGLAYNPDCTRNSVCPYCSLLRMA